jgi:DNA mismatch endonuclease (patch repair protein)
MPDSISKEKRSWNMSRISGKNTKPEIIVRKYLHSLGFRFRIHQKDLPGKPDIVLPKYRTVVFVNGCFWHRHANCKYAYMPKSRTEFWNKKFNDTIDRDSRNTKALISLGWNVLIIWECEVKNENWQNLQSLIQKRQNI